ncbi:hypothetical protein B0O99DRAFT_595742 [Bisporella sp. PMI_857]|nr:hypothetical protein B0O99DRAFT_595742 [Bisporella sp. PMI_857]
MAVAAWAVTDFVLWLFEHRLMNQIVPQVAINYTRWHLALRPGACELQAQLRSALGILNIWQGWRTLNLEEHKKIPSETVITRTIPTLFSLLLVAVAKVTYNNLRNSDIPYLNAKMSSEDLLCQSNQRWITYAESHPKRDRWVLSSKNRPKPQVQRRIPHPKKDQDCNWITGETPSRRILLVTEVFLQVHKEWTEQIPVAMDAGFEEGFKESFQERYDVSSNDAQWIVSEIFKLKQCSNNSHLSSAGIHPEEAQSTTRSPESSLKTVNADAEPSTALSTSNQEVTNTPAADVTSDGMIAKGTDHTKLVDAAEDEPAIGVAEHDDAEDLAAAYTCDEFNGSNGSGESNGAVGSGNTSATVNALAKGRSSRSQQSFAGTSFSLKHQLVKRLLLQKAQATKTTRAKFKGGIAGRTKQSATAKQSASARTADFPSAAAPVPSSLGNPLFVSGLPNLNPPRKRATNIMPYALDPTNRNRLAEDVPIGEPRPKKGNKTRGGKGWGKGKT